jgi:proteasome lid subunit RPN8/RPN11
MQQLLEFYAPDGPERVGFFLRDGSVVEIQNIHPESQSGFDVSAEDILRYEDTAVGTWHTHPGAPANLSGFDMLTFLGWPDFFHCIVGSDGVRIFLVRNNKVVNTDGPPPDFPSRVAEEAVRQAD